MIKKFGLAILILFLLKNQTIAQNDYNNITLKNKKGQNIIFDSLINSNKPIIVSFWATWCSPCINELNNINDELETWEKESGLKLYAVTIDDSRSQASALGVAKGNGWDFDILFDANQDLKRALNVANIPHIFVFYKGKIAFQHTGYTPSSEKKLYAQVKKLITQP